MSHTASHNRHAFENYLALEREGLTVLSRRNMLKCGMAGLAGLSLPSLLRSRAEASGAAAGKSVILLWMTGGPSHIDTWDMKPQRPDNNRGPFSPIATSVPGIQICEHLPKQAAMMDRFTLIRSVDCKGSNHQPNTVMQTGDRKAAPRVNPLGDKYPAIGSIVAKHHGANDPSMPPYVVFQKHESHVAWGGYLGKQYDPFDGNKAAVLPAYDMVGNRLGTTTGNNIFRLPGTLNQERLSNRRTLMQDLDRLRSDIDLDGSMAALDKYGQQAYDMLLGRRAQQAFDLSLEPEESRSKYGEHLWCQQALLARRLVEAGVAFVTIDLSYHTASGTWDTHSSSAPPYGGIENGLGPVLPLFDHLHTTLVSDLEERGLLDDTLVLAMGEFGRTPVMSEDGRGHWPVVSSISLAGGGMRHGQVIGATDAQGGTITERPVTPGDLAATIYRHMGVPLDTTYEDGQGRPIYAVQENGQPVHELF